MRKKTLALISTFLLWAILARVGTADAVSPSISVSPNSITVNNPGDLFRVDIRVYGAPEITQWVIELTWNASVLELEHAPPSNVDIKEGDFLNSVDTTIFLKKPTALGSIPEATSATLNLITNSGDGLLMYVNFRAKAVGQSPIKIVRGFLIDARTSPPTAYPNTRNNGTVTVVPEFPASMLLPFFLTATSIAIIAVTVLSRKRRISINLP